MTDELTPEEIKKYLDDYLDEMGWVISKDGMQYAWLKQLIKRVSQLAKVQKDELTPELRNELEGMKPEYQDKLAELLRFASDMGAYGDPFGILAIISPTSGRVLKSDKAQLAKKADVCPECGDKRFIFKTDKLHPEGTNTYTLSCPTCKGTGKAVPKLREKIAERLYTEYSYHASYKKWVDLPDNEIRQEWLERANQIQVLCEKEIRKDERERIIAIFDKNLALAPIDNAYFRILAQDVIEFLRTGKTASQRGHENYENYHKALKEKDD
ncbi:hypothetical protein LCGC14_0383460 [marine sediment metagenome]|uniref:Uncharacterized protein n=1 Tax=marine sediment metagenome TaxID=412755 RepID=A0A0F9TJU5_9ZZZZ